MPTISSLSTIAKTSLGANDYLLTANGVADTNYKLLAEDLFPTVNTLGTSSEALFISITNKNSLNFKGIKSLSNLISVATVSNNIELNFDQTLIDLDLCDNSTSGFLSTVALATNVTGTLPVANGGTGATTFTANSLLLGNGTSAVASLGVATNGQLVIGRTGLSPVLANLTAGTNVTITNGSGTITIAASLTTLTAALNAATYNIYGFGWLSGDGNNEGIAVDSSGRVFMGSTTPTAFYDQDLNVQNGISLRGSVTQNIKLTRVGTAADFYITGGTSTSSSSNGGDLYLLAGDGGSAADGGNVFIRGGVPGSGSAGLVFINSLMTVDSTTYKSVRIGGTLTASTGATLTVEQADASANIPVVSLEQDDTNESFIAFVGTSGAASANSISSSTGSTSSKVGAIRVKINGTDRWIRLYDTAE
jgi:hypothetical protein